MRFPLEQEVGKSMYNQNPITQLLFVVLQLKR